MVKLEKIYKKKTSNEVVLHQRVLTPFFYIKLKPVSYFRKEYMKKYKGGFCVGFVFVPAIPCNPYTCVEWRDKKGNKIFDKKLLLSLGLAFDKGDADNNVVSMAER